MKSNVSELDGATPLDPDEFESLKFNHVKTRGELDERELGKLCLGGDANSCHDNDAYRPCIG